MLIKLSNIIEIEEPTPEVFAYCENQLKFKNPDYEKRKAMGYWVVQMPKEIKLYNYYNQKLYLPIGCFGDLYRMYPDKKLYRDYSVVVPRHIESNIKLRTYQQPCLIALEKYVNGLFVLPAGTGKTQCALECAAKLQQHTIWITHTKDLMNQAKERCEQNMLCTTSCITEGKCDTSGDIVFCTVQTLRMFVERQEISQDEFGLLIIDECHKLSVSAESTKMFEQCLNYFASRYKLGISATLWRADGLAKCIPKLLGDVLYEVKKEDDKLIGYFENKKVCEVPLIDFQIPIRVNIIRTDYSILDRDVFNKDGMTLSYAKLITDIGRDSKRNKQIIDIVNSLPGSTLILSDRVEQLKILHEFIPSSVQIDGSTNKNVREQAIDDVRSGKIRVLLASYQLAKEGLDIIRLENLVMGTPVKDFAIVVQSCGRIQRPFGDKKIGTVYDLVDDVSFLNRFYSKRKSIYKKEQWEVIK